MSEAEKTFQVVSFGDLTADMVVTIPQLPVLAGKDQLVEQIVIEPGGAGNFLIAGARLGLRMSSLAAVGADSFGRPVLDVLRAEGVEVSGVVCQESGTTTTVLVLVDRQGQHVFLGQYGAGPDIPFSPTWAAALERADALQAWGYTLEEPRLTGAMLESMHYAHIRGVPVFFDPGPQLALTVLSEAQRARLLASCRVILLTEDEIPHVTGGITGGQGVHSLLERGPSLVCVKKGAEGCDIYTHNGIFAHAGFPVVMRDTTAAGDSFAAGFIYGYLRGWPLSKVAAFANAVGAAKVRKVGSGRQVPTREEVQAVLDEFGTGIHI